MPVPVIIYVTAGRKKSLSWYWETPKYKGTALFWTVIKCRHWGLPKC